MTVKVDLYTLKEAHHLLSFYGLAHILGGSSTSSNMDMLTIIRELKGKSILNELICLITGLSLEELSRVGIETFGEILGKFIKRFNITWQWAEEIFSAMNKNGNTKECAIKNDNVYMDYCLVLGKIGNYDPRLYNVADYAFILYKHNLEIEEENEKLKAMK